MITRWDDNIENLKNKEWFLENYPENDDFYFASNSNTFQKNKKEGEYFYLYAEDAVRMVQRFDDIDVHQFWSPHIAEFDIATDILAEYLGLGIYENYYERNLSNDPYYISLEFSIPYDVIAENYRDNNWKHSCITGKIYSIQFYDHFENAIIPEDMARTSYKHFYTVDLPIIMKMLNVDILPPEGNYYMRNMYGFNKPADDYSKEEAVKILRNLDRSKR